MSLEAAFAEYRAGNCGQAVVLMRETLRTVVVTKGSPAATGGGARSELATRALAFLTEIGTGPTNRETAAALMMVGAVLDG